MALMDPVATGVQGELAVPPNVKGQVLVVQAEHENRSWFRPLDYSDDPRVITVRHPGNHVGVGGGYDRNGTAANVHEGITAYFQRRGLPLVDVPPEQRHDPSQRPTLPTLSQVSKDTAPENVRNAATVVIRMMRAMRPLSAPKRSASSETLLALGSAAASTITVSAAGESGTPSWIAAVPTASTSSGCSSSFISATGT
ncbi:hypothetical protein D9M68_730930 [compost metagenome]